MVRLIGVNIPSNKSVETGLTYIHGIGRSLSRSVCSEVGVDPNSKVVSLSESRLVAIKEAVSKYLVEGDLKRLVALNIKRLININCYRGIRHRKRLPTRGQRTRTNAKTRKNSKPLNN
ncbi:30S ribosomal protein S13 [Candidatus Tremblaya phenacola]|uniref:Small ribosomal subunit protein uS13 n=1 Tax=Candidatus Tremblayella phenacoccinincola TaxID=1010676 RepID=A0A2G0V6U8_9PROT|nr:30S ribosomal protein S13 [Candidatus Tremblaya phenacola]PHN16195.1 30S ribosomal protein S13 [Candidatus Tremblaya phenacola]